MLPNTVAKPNSVILVHDPSFSDTDSSTETPLPSVNNHSLCRSTHNSVVITSKDSYSSNQQSNEQAIIPLPRLLSVVNSNLGDCNLCKGQKLELVSNGTLNVASRLSIICASCQQKRRQLYDRKRNLDRRVQMID